MKTVFILVCCQLLATYSFSQTWTTEQKEKANTAKQVAYLTNAEKEVIQYINLCRMYPTDFAMNEVENYNGIPGIKDKSLKKYKTSLLKELAGRSAFEPLQVDKALSDDARCFAHELSKNNKVGHERTECKERQYAECLSFGMVTARQMVLEWLIDSGISSLGHRKNCLNSRYKKMGISMASHADYGSCAVAEFSE